MKVLVTGGTGFTGKALVRRLIEDGHDAIVLDCKEGYRTDQIRDWGARIEFGTITDPGMVDRCMHDVEVVQHVAAAFREVGAPDVQYHRVNVEGTRILLEAALRHGVRKFVYCSTCGVHGQIDSPPADEQAPIRPADYYQQTKYDAELLVHEYYAKGLNGTILRPAGNYGPGDPGRFLMLFRQVAKGYFPMFGDGRTLYHPGFIGNLLDAFMAVMADGCGDRGTYLIADEAYCSLNELVEKVAEAMDVEVRIRHLPLSPLIVAGHVCEQACRPFGIAPPIFPRRVDWYRQDRAFSIAKAKREIGYQPRVSLEEGLRITADWYRSEGFAPTAGRGGRSPAPGPAQSSARDGRRQQTAGDRARGEARVAE